MHFQVDSQSTLRLSLLSMQLQHKPAAILRRRRTPIAGRSASPRTHSLRSRHSTAQASGSIVFEFSELHELTHKPAPNPAATEVHGTESKLLQQRCSMLRDSGIMTTCMSMVTMLWKLILEVLLNFLGGQVPVTAQLVCAAANQLMLGAWLCWWAMYTASAWQVGAMSVACIGLFMLIGFMLPLTYCCCLHPGITPWVITFAMSMFGFFLNFTQSTYQAKEQQLQQP